ncbi:HAD family hydrolase [Kangiella koreensis]|uniref:Phosphoglycolate phosphatase n=1 Tax=Kangiella koreensis (strain DSM 16069 / JCM 12317 / KCTC 12182 / SW-125) TaxID=523791 RepID=C7RAL7_KANKD|nr:HAD-IA family hydrolase [Kangiella koreensis]ACV26309.1 phosphoglycolate phosphatase [Kangiella koreensis DSM 16069]
MSTQPRAVFFDLDGTLLDTAPDMALALNIQREVHGKEPLPFSEVRPYVSHGAAAMLRIGFGLEPQHKEFDEFRKQYLNIYADNIAVHTELFNGLQELLEGLHKANIAWGIATNKPEFLTIPLLEALKLRSSCNALVCGDTVKPTKPHPNPLFSAAQQAGVKPVQSVYVGDAWRDIAAGRAAGMKTVIAEYGYIQPEDNLLEWLADATAKESTDLKALLLNR